MTRGLPFFPGTTPAEAVWINLMSFAEIEFVSLKCKPKVVVRFTRRASEGTFPRRVLPPRGDTRSHLPRKKR